MRMIMDVAFPLEPFNTLVRKGAASGMLQKILAATKPQAVYFTDQDGRRGAVLIVEMREASDIPMLAEPWFLSFNAECRFRVAMTPEDLARAELDKVAKMW